ncbi:MAG: recombinase family protein [Acetatifactor sp.]
METVDYRTPAMKRKSSQMAEKNGERTRIAIYSRVSTRHQTLAIKNQNINLETEITKHPEWVLVKEYKDEGKSATTTDNRDAFKQMYKDVEIDFKRTGKPPFDLIVCAELCRFSRSLSDTLVYIDRYKSMGVEIAFLRDGIYTFSNDATIKLGIFAGLAASESEKVRERVNAGLTACRQKGVLFGSGNILGYDLVQPDPKDKTKNTYVKNSDASTIYQIYKWYLEGYGEKKICSLLIEGHYTNTQGKVSWSPSTISRYLQCKTFAGYKSYLLSQTDTDGFHRREKLSDEHHIYIKGDWEPIIPLEMWEEVQKIRKSKSRIGVKNGVGKRPTTDCWMKVLKCECGKSFAKFRWRVNRTGEECYGYQCRNIVDHRRKSFHKENGLSGEGRCDVRSIPEWKLNFQFMKILQLIWEDPKEDAKYLETVIEESYEAENTFVDETPRISKQIEILKRRMAVLVDKYLDGMITEDIYYEKYSDLKGKIEAFEVELKGAMLQLEEHQSRAVTEEEKEAMLVNVRAQLEAMVEITKGKLEETAIQSLISALIDRVTPTEAGEFRWYLSLGGETPTVGFDEKNYVLLHELTVKYDEARAYRKGTGSYLRVRQWQDIDMKVFVRG